MQLGNFSFIKNSESRNSGFFIFFLNFCVIILINAPLCICLESFHFRYLKGVRLLILSIKKVLGKVGSKLQNDLSDLSISILGFWKVLVSNMASNLLALCFYVNWGNVLQTECFADRMWVKSKMVSSTWIVSS